MLERTQVGRILPPLLLAGLLPACNHSTPVNQLPTTRASFIQFQDMDSMPGTIGGSITIGKASNESNITHYVLRWGQSGHCQANNSFIAEIPKADQDLRFYLPIGTLIPAQATELLVYTKNAAGEMGNCQSQFTQLRDNQSHLSESHVQQHIEKAI